MYLLGGGLDLPSCTATNGHFGAGAERQINVVEHHLRGLAQLDSRVAADVSTIFKTVVFCRHG